MIGNNIKKDIAGIINGNIIHLDKGSLTVGKLKLNGYLALTEDTLNFIELTKSKELKTALHINYSDIIFHKFYFEIFIEASNHLVYQLKTSNMFKAYNILQEKVELL